MEELPNIRKIAVLKATPARRAHYPDADTTVLDPPQDRCQPAVSFVNDVQVDEVLAAAFDLSEATKRFGRQGKP